VTKARLTLTFEDDDGAKREYGAVIPIARGKFEQGEMRLSQEIMADITVATVEGAEFTHNETACEWGKFPSGYHEIAEMDDIHNSRELWRELTNSVLGIEHDLADAEGYKNLEPHAAPDFNDEEGVERLFYLHRRKMEHFNRAVCHLVKVQELVNRLLHEGLGGDLVNTASSQWEKEELRRSNVKKGLERKAFDNALTDEDHKAIAEALDLPEKVSCRNMVINYRNRLLHHVNPSVDYSMFHCKPRSRRWESVRDSDGKITSWVRAVVAMPAPDFTFASLHAAHKEYFESVVEMLDRLSKISVVHR
jgi:hypothetical protein